MGDTTRQVRIYAIKGEPPLTLGNLRQFIADLDQSGATDDTPVKARVSWRGWLRELSASAVRFGDRGSE